MTSNQADNSIICQVCGHKNLVGTLMCNNCGAMLVNNSRRSGTRNLADEMPEFRTNPVFTSTGSGVFKSGMSLRLSIEGKTSNLTVDPTLRSLMIGRRDAMSQQTPDIDMEDFEGYRLGVSRRHAQLSVSNDELTLQDYGSANGTFINGVRIPAHRPHKVNDGDEVRLGNLTMRVFFV